MVLHPLTGWTRTGKAYGSRTSAKEWIPFVRGAFRGLRARVCQCTLTWKDGHMTEASKKILSEKFNMDPPE